MGKLGNCRRNRAGTTVRMVTNGNKFPVVPKLGSQPRPGGGQAPKTPDVVVDLRLFVEGTQKGQGEIRHFWVDNKGCDMLQCGYSF